MVKMMFVAMVGLWYLRLRFEVWNAAKCREVYLKSRKRSIRMIARNTIRREWLLAKGHARWGAEGGELFERKTTEHN